MSGASGISRDYYLGSFIPQIRIGVVGRLVPAERALVDITRGMSLSRKRTMRPGVMERAGGAGGGGGSSTGGGGGGSGTGSGTGSCTTGGGGSSRIAVRAASLLAFILAEISSLCAV